MSGVISNMSSCLPQDQLSVIELLAGVQIPKINLEPGYIFDANVCYSFGPSSLFIHPWISRKFVLRLTRIMEFLYSDAPQDNMTIDPRNYEPGLGIVAQFDGDYYRAKVIKRTSPSQFEVVFPDFGNVSTVRLSEIRKLHHRISFENLPPLAIKLVDCRGQEICRDRKTPREDYDDAFDARILTVQLQVQNEEQDAWMSNIFVYGEDEVHPLNKPKEEDVTLDEFDAKAGFTNIDIN